MNAIDRTRAMFQALDEAADLRAVTGEERYEESQRERAERIEAQ